MRLVDCFKEFYGPDIAGVAKGGPLFYLRIFKDTNTDPSSAIIIEDQPRYLVMAEQAGAQVIQSCVTGEYAPVVSHYYHNSSELPKLVFELIDSLNQYQ